MLYIDDKYFDQTFFQQKKADFQASPYLQSPKGKRYAICLQDPADFLALVLYLKEAGASLFPMSPDTPVEAARRQAQRSQCHGLIYQDVANYSQLERTDLDSAGHLIQMSSGSTGEPKILERSWDDVDTEIESYCSTFTQAQAMTPVIACPTHHSYGLISGIFVARHRGIEPIILTNINPKYIIRKLCETPNHLFYASPMLIHSVTLLFPRGQKLHAVMTSGTAIREALLEHLKSRATHVFQQYGCSEVGCISISIQPDSPENVGIPLPHLKIETSHSETEPSEIVIRKGDCCTHTSDLGYLSADQQLHCLSRVDDMINVAGINVYPAEVENLLFELEGIQDAVIYKLVNSFGHVQVCLRYVADSTITEKQIRDWCGQQLSPHQRPQILEPVTSIPRMPNGKINRQKLSSKPADTPTLIESK